MRRLFDNDNGYLILDELVMESPSFQAVIQDRFVSDEEVIQQANTVIDLLKLLDETLNEEDKELVIKTIIEIAVLYQINVNRGE